MALELRPSSSVRLDDLVALFNEAYAGYVIPFRIDDAGLRAMVDSFDIDLDASRVAFRGDEAVGLANLALRGDEAWVGGVGVVPAARRQGVARALMRALHAEAQSRGVRRIWLEVIEQNEAAFRLYERLGYAVTRWVDVWTLDEASTTSRAREVDAAEAHARVRELRRTREPWQRADATVANHEDARGLLTERSAAVFRDLGGRVLLLQLAGDDAEELLRTLRAEGPVTLLNLPEDDPAADALRALGGKRVVRQREMTLTLPVAV